MPYVRLSAEEKARRKAIRDEEKARRKAMRDEEKARLKQAKQDAKAMKIMAKPAEKLVMKSSFIGPLLPQQRKRTSKEERLIKYVNKRNEVLARRGLPPISFPGMVPNIIPEAVPSILPPGAYVPPPRVRRPRAPRAPPAPPAPAPAPVRRGRGRPRNPVL